MPFKNFKTLIPKSPIEALHATKNNLVVLKKDNQSNIEQIGVCTVKLRYKDKITRYRFFVVPGDGPALLGMPEIELLGILKIMCDVIEGQQADRNFDSQTMEPSSGLSCKVNIDWESRSDNVDAININSNMQDYFRSSTEREADKMSS